MNNDTATLSDSIRALSDKIAPMVAAYDTAAEAHEDELTAQVALVTKILEIMRPAVRALGTRPVISDSWRSGGNYESTEERASWRGLILTCEPRKIGPSRRKDPGDDFSGAYEGSDVFLSEDGTLTELSYSGTFSSWQGAECGWRGTERVIPVEDFCRRWESAEPADLVKHLLGLVNAAGDRISKAKASTERAAKLRAIAALL